LVVSASRTASAATSDASETCRAISEIEADSSSAAAATVSTLTVACSAAAATRVAG
jgi:hypothetical protein